MTHFLIEAARYRSHGNTGLYLWLWHRLHWWGIPVYVAILTVVGSFKEILSDIFHR